MPKISIQPNAFSAGYTAWVPNSKPQPTLSFMDSMALRSTATGIWDLTAETRGAKRELESINYEVGNISDQLRALESELGLRLREQTEVLEQQVNLLLQIRDAVLTPNKTRAAERAADGAQLLRKARYERALKVAEEGIEADPNNPAVFFVAGWALAGMDEADKAREMFEEASEAADGDERSRAARQAARAALIGERYELAYDLVRDARAAAESADEKAALAYDIAICAWANDDTETALEALTAACSHDSRFCHLALLDVAFKKATPIKKKAGQILRKEAKATATARAKGEELVDELVERLPAPPELTHRYDELGHDIRPERNAEISHRALKLDLEVAETGLEESLGADSLQSARAVLREAEGAAAEGLKLVPSAEQDIESHEEADARHSEIAGVTAELESESERAARQLRTAESAVRRTRGIAKFGVFFLLVGLLLNGLLVIGLLMVLPFVVAWIARGTLKGRRDSLQAEAAIGREDLAPGEASYADVEELEEARVMRRLGALHAALRVCVPVAERLKEDGQLDVFCKVQLEIAEMRFELEQFDQSEIEALKAVAAGEELEDKTIVRKARALASKARKET